MNPGQPIYALGSPLFDRATIHLENGKTFTVEAVQKTAGDIYVQSATLNGRALERAWIAHDEVVQRRSAPLPPGTATEREVGCFGPSIAGFRQVEITNPSGEHAGGGARS